ncbi:MAG: hypothetical protein R6U04_01845 [Bacteroidales bacterium]
MRKVHFYFIGSILLLLMMLSLLVYTCSKRETEKRHEYKELEVEATAYNSTWNQTLGHPAEAAWGDTLKPGMKAIAVSRDLIDSGLTYGTKVQIEELPGDYIVLDKMNVRWNNKIDIYMGESTNKALEWGNQEVKIRWKTDNRSLVSE